MARPQGLDAKERTLVCARWLNGESASALAKDFGCAVNTIRNVLKEASITRADRQASTGAVGKREAIAAYSAIDQGNPDDPLDCADWLFKAAVVSAKRVATDPNYPGTEEQRRKEISVHATTAQKLMPAATLRAAKKALEKDAKDMSEGAGPEMRKVATQKPKRTRRKQT